MAFTKLELDGLTKPLVDLYVQLEQELLTNIAKRLKANPNITAKDVEAWKLQQLQILGVLDKDNLKLIKKYTEMTSAQINQILYNAGIEGLDQTDQAMKNATKKGAHLKTPKPLGQSPQLITILKSYQAQAHNTFNLTNMTLLKQAHSIYTNIVNKTTLDVISGTKTHDQALRDTIKQWAEYGIPALVDKGGKKWGTEGYVRMVINTTAHNTTHAMQDQRMMDYGIELVEVSSHAGARPLCEPYQGRIYSVKGKMPKYPNLYTDTSYGQPAGLFGINCHHMKYPYIEGVSKQTYFPYPKQENDKVYKESQVQRAHERSIRAAKTQLEMYKANGDEEGMKKAKALISQRQSNLRDFIDETGRTRRRDREQIVKVNDIPKKPLPKETPHTEPNIQQTVTPAAKPLNFNDLKTGDSIEYKDKFGNVFGGTVQGKLTNELSVNSSIDGKLYWTHKDNIVSHNGIKIDNNAKQTVNKAQTVTKVNEPAAKTPKAKPDKPVKEATTKYGPKKPNTYENISTNHLDLLRDAQTIQDMPRENSKIINKYTGSYYSTMNDTLRREENNNDVLKECKLLHNTLKKFAKPLSKNTLFYRNIRSNALPYIFNEEIANGIDKAVSGRATEAEIAETKSKLIGGAITDKGFVSTTYVKGSFGSGMDVNIEIYAPKGYKGGMFVESISEFRSENEYLFNSNAHFDIFDVVFNAGNIIFKVVPR